ncbi:MAG: hypothetical protein ABIJ23_00050 [Candidatus Magasanikbacteria bacterium]
MKTPLYQQAIVHSWKLAWEHKILWVFGLFAVFLGQMGILDLLGKVVMSASNSPLHIALSEWFLVLKNVIFEFKSLSLSLDIWIWFFSLGVVILGFGLFLVFVSVISQGALIKAAAVSVKHKKLPNAGEEWHVGVNHFWPLFFVNLGKKIVFCILSLFVSWLAFLTVINFNLLWGLLFLFGFILATLIGMIASFLSIYVAGYIVVEKFNFEKACVSAWKLFLGHWLVSMEVGLIVLLLNLLVGLIVFIFVMILVIPTLASGLLVAASYNPVLWFVSLLFRVGVPVLLIMVVGSIFTVFNTSVWTCLFMAMHKVGLKSRILHWLGK